jgi:cytochrome c oxidase cbb3-type subunit IV
MDGTISYKEILEFTRSWDVVYFLIVFAAACIYALWPSNKKKFDEAAEIPLHDDEDS